jgi:Mg2+ and Co2+ transporter CorA
LQAKLALGDASDDGESVNPPPIITVVDYGGGVYNGFRKTVLTKQTMHAFFVADKPADSVRWIDVQNVSENVLAYLGTRFAIPGKHIDDVGLDCPAERQFSPSDGVFSLVLHALSFADSNKRVEQSMDLNNDGFADGEKPLDDAFDDDDAVGRLKQGGGGGGVFAHFRCCGREGRRKKTPVRLVALPVHMIVADAARLITVRRYSREHRHSSRWFSEMIDVLSNNAGKLTQLKLCFSFLCRARSPK